MQDAMFLTEGLLWQKNRNSKPQSQGIIRLSTTIKATEVSQFLFKQILDNANFRKNISII